MNIALIDAGVPVMSVVHVPVTGVSYLACAGKGAFRQEPGAEPRPIHVRTLGEGPVMVVGSRSHRGDSLNRFLENLGEHDMVGSDVGMGYRCRPVRRRAGRWLRDGYADAAAALQHQGLAVEPVFPGVRGQQQGLVELPVGGRCLPAS